MTLLQAVVTFTPGGVVTEANDLFLDTMGYDLHEVVGKHHRLFMDSKAAATPEYAQFWAELGNGSSFCQGDFERVNKSGKIVWLNATYTPIVIEGRVVKIVKYAQDITEQKLGKK